MGPKTVITPCCMGLVKENWNGSYNQVSISNTTEAKQRNVTLIKILL